MFIWLIAFLSVRTMISDVEDVEDLDDLASKKVIKSEL
jgi:hypothetical protein